MNGIYFKGIEYLAYKNLVSGKGLDLAAGYPYVHTDPLSPALIVFNEAKGDFGNSMLAGNQITGVKFINAPEANFYYSSIKAESNTYPAISVENEAGIVRRNIFHNPAKSSSIIGNGTITSDENAFWSETSFAKWDNTTYANIADWTLATNNDLQSSKSFLEFVDLDDLHLNRVVAEIIFSTPIATVPDIIQDFDFDGNERISYFGGCDELVLAVHIINQSKDVINCHGSYNTISVTAIVDYDAPSYYQWEKDYAPIKGENKNIIVFDELDYSQSGTYRCRITGPGNTPAVYTNDIKVYALSAPEFIKQPQSVITAKTGNEYQFTAKIHYKGISTPLYDDGFQWFRYTESDKKMVPLMDDERISGSTSTILSIKDLKSSDLCKKGDYYILEVYSLCDTILSDPFIISNAVNIVTKTNPENLFPCPGSDVVFHSEATVPDGYEIEYQWQKDGVDIIDGLKANGATTNTLQLFGVVDDDEGGYVCVATIKGTSTSAISKPGVLNLKLIPVADYITSQNITIKRGKYVEMKGNVIEGTGPITVKWMYKDILLKEGIWTDVDGDQIMTYSIDTVKEDHAGKYYCIITNDCDEIQLEFVLKVTKWDEANDVAYDSDKNYFLYEVTPNPASSNSAVKFSIPTPTTVNICITNLNGETVATLANTSFQAGENSVALGNSISNLANGTYFVKLESNGVVLIRKFIVSK